MAALRKSQKKKNTLNLNKTTHQYEENLLYQWILVPIKVIDTKVISCNDVCGVLKVKINWIHLRKTTRGILKAY